MYIADSYFYTVNNNIPVIAEINYFYTWTIMGN